MIDILLLLHRSDMRMLDDFVYIWHQRFKEKRINEKIANRCFKDKPARWIDVPYLFHKDAINQSLTYVSPLILDTTRPFIALAMNDVSPSGIDFHCSNVLDFILRNDDVYSNLSTKVSLYDGELSSLSKGIDGLVTKESLINVLKGCMWSFSSGINVRRSLSGIEKKAMKNQPLYELWSVDVEPHVKSFVTKYISARLSRF